MSKQRWQEQVTGFETQGDPIDREAGVIKGVKILGQTSKNGRKYLPEAIAESQPLYEGSKVYIDHVDPKKSKERPTRERWGQIQNTHLVDGEGYGDLHYIKAHPMTEAILEALERFKDFGLSHDATGEVSKQNGEKVVTKIHEVHSVDLVQRPATNTNLFEGERAKLLATLRENIDEPIAAPLLARITEMGVYDETTEMDLGAGPDAVHSAFKAAAMVILDNDEWDLSEKLSKLRTLLSAESAVQPEDTEMTEQEIAELTAERDRLQEENKTLAEQNESLEAEKTKAADMAACTKLLEEHGREVSEVRVEALLPMEADKRVLLVESWPKKEAPKHKPAASPGVTTPDPESVTESVKLPETAEDFKKRLVG